MADLVRAKTKSIGLCKPAFWKRVAKIPGEIGEFGGFSSVPRPNDTSLLYVSHTQYILGRRWLAEAVPGYLGYLLV